MTYPYIGDKGNGTIRLIDCDVSTILLANVSTECPYHIALDTHQCAIEISSLRVDLDSKMDYIFEAFIGMITDTLLDVFNNQMTDVFRDLFIQVGNDGLADSSPISYIYNGHDTICTDQRYLSIEVYDKYFKVGFVGQLGFLKYNPGARDTCVGTGEVAIDSVPA